ncbi:hypothetical protein OIU76_028834, partial [Salix suchowensis]
MDGLSSIQRVKQSLDIRWECAEELRLRGLILWISVERKKRRERGDDFGRNE